MSANRELPIGIEAPAIALATAGAMGITMSNFLHRGETHGAVDYHTAVRHVGKFATWMLSGMSPKEWEVVHLTHHAFTETEPSSEQWMTLQEQFPGAPIEAFRDPHSPILEGHAKVLFKNGPMYRRSANAIMPYMRDLDAQGVPRDQWPPHLSGVDLTEDWMDRHVYNRKNAGVMGLVALGGAIAVARGPKKAVAAMAIHIPLVLGVGGGVNTFGHLGTAKGFKEKAKVVLGIEEAQPDENGSYASDFFTGFEGIVAGEGRHKHHHEHPNDAFISSRNNPIRDPSGVIVNIATHIKLGGKKLAEIPTSARAKFAQRVSGRLKVGSSRSKTAA